MSLKCDKSNGTLHADRHTFLITSRSVLRVRMFQTQAAEDTKTHILCSVTLFLSENRAVYEIMLTSMVKPDSPQTKIWLMRFACWVRKATNTPRIRNMSCLSSTIMVTRTRLSIKLYVHCVSSYGKSRVSVTVAVLPRGCVVFIYVFFLSLSAYVTTNIATWQVGTYTHQGRRVYRHLTIP